MGCPPRQVRLSSHVAAPHNLSPPGVVLMKKLKIPQNMRLAFNENAYWNKEINLEYLKWLREQLTARGHDQVLCVFDSFTGQVGRP